MLKVIVKAVFTVYTVLFTFSLSAQSFRLGITCTDQPDLIGTINFKQQFAKSEEASKEVSNLIATLRNRSYLLAQIDSFQVTGNRIVYYIHAGASYRCARLSAGNLDPALANKLGYSAKRFNNKAFSPLAFENLCENIIRYYENNGYPFASVQFDSLLIAGDSISAVLNIKKNKFYSLDSILVVGTAKINSAYLQRYLNLKQGMPYNEEVLAGIGSRIRQLPFLSEKQPQKVQITQKGSKLYLFLDKKNASQFDGIVGILPDVNTGRTVITGDVKLKLVNGILRNGETFDIEWRRLQTQTQDFNGKLIYPYLLRSPLGIDYAIKIYRKDSTFTDINNNFGLQYYFSALNYFKVFYKVRSSSLISTSGLSGIASLPDYADISTGAYGMGAAFEQLDYRFNPRKGYALAASVQAGQRNIRKNPAINELVYEQVLLNSTQYQMEGNIAGYLAIGAQQTIKLALQAASVFGNATLYRNELFRIGGLKTLRGFDEESIYASTYVIPTIEYRYLFARNSNLLVFAEGAWYENNSNGDYLNDRPISAGAGINFDTKAGIFSMYYALGNQFGNGFDLRNGKIHFGLTALF